MGKYFALNSAHAIGGKNPPDSLFVRSRQDFEPAHLPGHIV